MCERVFFFCSVDFQPTPKTEMSCCCSCCSCCCCHAHIVITNQTLHKFKIENWQRVVHCQPTLKSTLGIWLELSSVSLSLHSLSLSVCPHCIALVMFRLLPVCLSAYCWATAFVLLICTLDQSVGWVNLPTGLPIAGLAWLRFRSLQQQAQRLHN